MARRFSTFLFDWDGCLADTLNLWLRSYHEHFYAHACPVTDEEIIAIFGDLEGPGKLGIKDNHAFLSRVDARVQELAPEASLHKDVSATLQALRARGVKIAIVTSASQPLLEPVIERQKLQGMFDVIVDKTMVARHKPDPQPLEKALELLGSHASDAIMIGDMFKDIQAGKAAGVATALFFPDANSRFYKLEALRAYAPDYVITDFHRLLDLAV